MKWTTSILSEYLEKYSAITYCDFLSILANLDGKVKDIANGTHIKIPTDAGYVNFYKSQNSLEITVWMKSNIQEKISEQKSLKIPKSKEL